MPSFAKLAVIITVCLCLACALNQGTFLERAYDVDGNVTDETRYKHTNASTAGAKQSDGTGSMTYTWSDFEGNLQIGASVKDQTTPSPTSELTELLNTLLQFQRATSLYAPLPPSP